MHYLKFQLIHLVIAKFHTIKNSDGVKNTITINATTDSQNTSLPCSGSDAFSSQPGWSDDDFVMIETTHEFKEERQQQHGSQSDNVPSLHYLLYFSFLMAESTLHNKDSHQASNVDKVTVKYNKVTSDCKKMIFLQSSLIDS